MAKSARQRDSSFDAVKGILVLFMVIYHVMSIMTSADPEYFRYLRFVSGSFILASGFILARFMRESFRTDPTRISRRLVWRGLKILAIFTALNLLIHATGVGNEDKISLGTAGFFRQASTIYLQGDGQHSSFLILLPIAYLLLLSPLVLAGSLRGSRPGWALLIASIATASFPALTANWPVLEFVLVGLIGLCIGIVCGDYELATFPHIWRWPLILAFTVACVWVTGHVAGNVAAYSLGIAGLLKMIYEAVACAPARGRWMSALVLLGRYSLLNYIAQIALIQVTLKALGIARTSPSLLTVVMCLATAAVLLAVSKLTDRLRRQSSAIDRCYRLVFA